MDLLLVSEYGTISLISTLSLLCRIIFPVGERIKCNTLNFQSHDADSYIAGFEAHPFVNVAIISPVIVYGFGPSLDHPFPLVFPEYLKVIQSLGSGFTVSKGANIMGYAHVRDRASFYLILLSYALPSRSEEKAINYAVPKHIILLRSKNSHSGK
jgi:hypothetical protein